MKQQHSGTEEKILGNISSFPRVMWKQHLRDCYFSTQVFSWKLGMDCRCLRLFGANEGIEGITMKESEVGLGANRKEMVRPNMCYGVLFMRYTL